MDTIKDIEGDIRYFLSDIEDHAENETLDLSTETTCRLIHKRFMNALMGTLGITESESIRSPSEPSKSETWQSESLSSSDDEEDEYVPPLSRSQSVKNWKVRRQMRKAQSSANLSILLQHSVSEPTPALNNPRWKGRARTVMNASEIQSPAFLCPSPLKKHCTMSTLRLDLENFDILPDVSDGLEGVFDGKDNEFQNLCDLNIEDLDLENLRLTQIVDLTDLEDGDNEFRD